MKILLSVLVFFAMSCSSHMPCEKIWKEFHTIEANTSDKGFLLKSISEYLKDNSKCLDAFIIRGDLFMDLDSFKLAKADYRSVLKADPANVYSLYQLGLLLQFTDSNEAAIGCLAISAKTKNGATTSYSKVPGVVDEYSKYDIQYDELLFSRGLSYYILRKLNSSMNDFDLCLHHDYLLKDTYFYLGAILYEKGEKDKACEYLSRALTLKHDEAGSLIDKYCNH